MLNELLRWLHKTERRTADRKNVHFPLTWYKGEEAITSVGTEISANGILFFTPVAPESDAFDVAFTLPNRKVRARVQVRRRQEGVSGGKTMTMLASTFSGIAADDYDAVMRFLRDLPEPEHKASDELSALASNPDDAFRMLPLAVQERVVGALVGAGRLAQGSDAKNPLLRMSYLGKTRANVHRLQVHSRRNDADEVLHFESVLAIDDKGDVKLER